LEEPSAFPREREPVGVGADEKASPMPSILVDDEDEIFKPASETVTFDAEEDLDIPDFLKS
jgi:hypothetical protein